MDSCCTVHQYHQHQTARQVLQFITNIHSISLDVWNTIKQNPRRQWRGYFWPVDNCAMGDVSHQAGKGYGTKHETHLSRQRSRNLRMCSTLFVVSMVRRASYSYLASLFRGSTVDIQIFLAGFLSIAYDETNSIVENFGTTTGSDVSPAARNCMSVSLIDIFDSCAVFDSTAVRALIETCGCSEQILSNNST